LVDASRVSRTQLESGVDRFVDVCVRVHGRDPSVYGLPTRRGMLWPAGGLRRQHRRICSSLCDVPSGEQRTAPSLWKPKYIMAADFPAASVTQHPQDGTG